MNRLLMLFTGLVLSYCSRAGDSKYPVSDIPEKMKKNANVVKRMEEVQYEITGNDEAVYRRKIVYTILNEEGDDRATMVVGYDKFIKVTNIDGSIYDADGKLVKKLKNKEIQDFSAIQDISLFDDNRVKVAGFNYHNYPFTVEYEVETKYLDTYSIPDWIPQPEQFMSVQSSSYSFIAPQDYNIRFKTFNYNGDAVAGTDRSKKTLTWKVADLPAIKKPYAAPLWNELTTVIYFAPSRFEYDGYKGDGSTWEDLGRFVQSLNEGRDKLPANMVQKVNELTAGITDQKEKVRVLYNYLQKNTRYISIQRGIGGLQPFEASFVAEKGYGDCKALSNYMYSLLKVAGIKSYYTLVRAGSGMDNQYLVEDFPYDPFNHIIICVPMQKDTMWLECTSQDTPPGYMGEFTGNRKALLLTENGGKLVSTPRYNLQENTLSRNIKATVTLDGTLNMNVQTRYGGTQQDELSMMINHFSKDKVQKILQQDLELSTYNINDFKYSETKAIIPELNEQLDITVNGYATVSGKRIFITPNILNKGGRKLDVDDQRTIDYVFNDEWKDEDQCEIEIPEGYELETSPADVVIKTKFGSYTSTTKLVGNKIIYHRVREQYSGRFPAKDGTDLSKYFADIYKADRARMVLVKKS
jgi:hypothetical protein